MPIPPPCPTPDAAPPPVVPSTFEIFLAFLRLGATAFGGPAMIAQMRELAVRRRRWLDDTTFTDGLVLAQSIPGATGMQVAGWVGLITRGPPGAVAAFAGFGLPAFVLMLALSAAYTTARGLPTAVALLDGLQVVVVALVANAAWIFARPLRRSPGALAVVAGSGVAYVLAVNPFAVIAGSALAGLAICRDVVRGQVAAGAVAPRAVGWRTWAVVGAVIVASAAALWLFGGRLFTLTATMVWINLFAFAGGFSSLPLMLHEVVSMRHWMDARTFMDGIALGQVTPGPISITSTFIGYRLAGTLGAVVATVAMFGPSLVYLVAIGPYFARLRASALYARASAGVMASFVALLGFITYRFAADITWRPASVALAVAALVALLREVDAMWVVLAGALIWLVVR